MLIFITALLVLLVSGGLAFVTRKTPRISTILGAVGCVLGCIIGLIPAITYLNGGHFDVIRWTWNIPYGSFFIGLDGLSAVFLALIFGLGALAAVFGIEYTANLHNQDPSVGTSWLFFNILIASMALVVVAQNGMLFLMAWEIMTISSFFLVVHDGEKKSVRKAGIIYLIAGQIGTVFLLVFFLILGAHVGSMDFDRIMLAFSLPISSKWILFFLALIGFGTKAGFIFLHVWLPEAHPAAPSHVSALMSGVMIKTGIYGLIRILGFLAPIPVAWGGILVVIGILTGLGGIIFAMAQHDLKRLLAYHSIENMGIITLGLGLGLIGNSIGSPALTALGATGAIFHVINHAIYKGLLFLEAGVIRQRSGTLEMDRLGGLFKQIPLIGFLFLTGSIAICGLPPLNGFISEFLIYFGALKGGTELHSTELLFCLISIPALVLMGGLSVVSFSKAFGVVFLGEPRSHIVTGIHKPGICTYTPLVLLGLICIVISLTAPWMANLIFSILKETSLFSASLARVDGALLFKPLIFISFISAFVIILICTVYAVMSVLYKRRPSLSAITWNCGYDSPNVRMQYTASSYAQPFTEFFKSLLRTHKQSPALLSYFIQKAAFKSETPDPVLKFYSHFSTWVHLQISVLRHFQHGRLQLYTTYILITLIVLLAWGVGLPPGFLP
ncbi:hydrogenase [Candidatus Nomurabacteria bacterium]|nr:hydrogenase [Candidatus Nomurabacteria bacterium]